jgi:hypothetical protein
LLRAYDALVGRGVAPEHAPRVAELRRSFEARTGPFGPEDPFFDARSAAFWDDAVTSGGFGRDAFERLPDALRGVVEPWLAPLERAHRGLFRSRTVGALRVVTDVLSNAEFVLLEVEDGMHDALTAASGADGGLFDGRVAAGYAPTSVALLPGAVFHPPEATDALLAVVREARGQKLDPFDVCDALLRMERHYRTLTRMKPAYAYRASELFAPPPQRRTAHDKATYAPPAPPGGRARIDE